VAPARGRVVSAFGDLASTPPVTLAPGAVARPLHGERLTFAVVEIDAGAALPAHSHDNEQLGMVLSGSVEFRIGDEERIVRAGGTWSIPSGVPHSLRAGAEGAVFLDVFAPVRDDWKSLDTLPPAEPRWP
jgi:quercetin dioxygenase-like cupin family protein